MNNIEVSHGDTERLISKVIQSGCDVRNIWSVNRELSLKSLKDEEAAEWTDDLTYCWSVLSLPIRARRALKLSLVFSS